MTILSWNSVIDRPTQRLEFGACHVREAWRRPKSANQKFLGLKRAFVTSNHRLTKLLQEVEANSNARNHPERGQAVFAAVWYPDNPWAILCNATHATLVARQELERISECKGRDEKIVSTLQCIFDRAPEQLQRVLDGDFFTRNIQSNV